MAANVNEVGTTQPTVNGTSNELVVIKGSSAVEAPTDTTHIFDFFGLPPELREFIYQQRVLLEIEQLPERSTRDFKSKIRKLRTSLLLVSRQFHDEYRKICASEQVLYMEDHPWMSGFLAHLQWPHKASVWVMDYCTGEEMELKGLMNFLNTWAVGDMALRSINIEIYIAFHRLYFETVKGNYEWLTLLGIDGFSKVDLLEIYIIWSSWDRRTTRTPRSLVGRWKRGDPMHITFREPSVNFYRQLDYMYDHPYDAEPGSTEDSDGQNDAGDSSGVDDIGGVEERAEDEGWYNHGGDA
jgi:hypothetical protein